MRELDLSVASIESVAGTVRQKGSHMLGAANTSEPAQQQDGERGRHRRVPTKRLHLGGRARQERRSAVRRERLLLADGHGSHPVYMA